MNIILVTGGTGLVGHGIKQILKTNNYTNYNKRNKFIFLSSKDCDLENEEKVKELFNNYKPNYVIHLAAYVGGLYRNMKEKVEMFEKNIKINLNVIKNCHKFNVKKLICCLSTCIFPDNIQYPINEDMLHNGPPHNSNDAYAYAKRMMEIHCNTYKEQYNCNFMCIIPTNIYGPNDNFSLENGHVIPAIIHKCYISKLESKPLIVFGSGKPKRQFIYSHDLGKIIIKLLLDYKKNDSIIISPNEEVEIKYIAEILLKHTKLEKGIEYDRNFSDGQYKKTASNKRLLDLFPDFKFTPLNKGLKNTYDWFSENYKLARK